MPSLTLPMVVSYLGTSVPAFPQWKTEIHPDDEMFGYLRSAFRDCEACAACLYGLQGHQMARTVRELIEWRWGSVDRVNSFLDFGSGWGRFIELS